MKKLLFVLSIVAVLSLLAAPAFAADTMTCDHSVATIESLQHCVMHHVTNSGVANSLTAKLDAAQAALVSGQPDVAINLLNAFINEVSAQSGKFIMAEHADHLMEHALMVIHVLGG